MRTQVDGTSWHTPRSRIVALDFGMQAHTFPVQGPFAQSLFTLHASPVGHAEHGAPPPQSTAVSLPFWTRSVHVGGVTQLEPLGTKPEKQPKLHAPLSHCEKPFVGPAGQGVHDVRSHPTLGLGVTHAPLHVFCDAFAREFDDPPALPSGVPPLPTTPPVAEPPVLCAPPPPSTPPLPVAPPVSVTPPVAACPPVDVKPPFATPPPVPVGSV
jgi:hypothetical protein